VSSLGVRAAALALLSTGCLGLVPVPAEPTSLGTTSDGWLVEGIPLADEGHGFVRARRGEGTRFGVPRLIAALMRAAESVDAEFGAGSPLLIGDVGSRFGGHHLRHRSHRAGRDVDILFFLADEDGWPVPSHSHAFSRFGFSDDEEAPDHTYFDDARNWHLVRTLLSDPEIEVQWIFCSRGIKSRLLSWAMLNEPDADLLVRAAYVLQQPENALPHDDHFHLRIYCSEGERAAGCVDVGPRWPWLRPDIEATSGRDGPGLDDATLLERLEAP
jgi:penicillin-insensitive murein endopeptidase